MLKVHFWVKTPVPDNHDDALSPSYNNGISWSQPWAYRKAYEADHEERYLLQTKWRNITSGPNSMYLTFSQLKMTFNSLIDSASCYKSYIYTTLTKPSLLRWKKNNFKMDSETAMTPSSYIWQLNNLFPSSILLEKYKWQTFFKTTVPQAVRERLTLQNWIKPLCKLALWYEWNARLYTWHM